MVSLLLVLVFAGLLIGVTVMSFAFYARAKKMEQQQQLPPGYAGTFTPTGLLPGGGSSSNMVGGVNLMNLKLGDIVSYFETDYIVEGRLNYWEEGYTWVTYMLTDVGERRWLSVEEDDELEVSMWEEVKGMRLAQPLPEYLEHEGERFRMVERGHARVNQQGKTGMKTGLQMEYFEYEGEGGENYLSVEKWAGEIEVSIGTMIHPATLDVLPGDEVEY